MNLNTVSFACLCCCQLQAVNQPLQSYLIMPVQRLPRYRMLLAELLKYADKHSKDTKQLELALEKVAKIADEINERKRAVRVLLCFYFLLSLCNDTPS